MSLQVNIPPESVLEATAINLCKKYSIQNLTLIHYNNKHIKPPSYGYWQLNRFLRA